VLTPSSCKAITLAALLSIAALLAGCGGLQTPAFTTSSLAAADGLKNEALLYAADAKSGTIYVLTYPQGAAVENFAMPNGSGDPQGECVGPDGGVWIVSFESGLIYKYPHGGTAPIAKLGGTGTAVYACSVDPSSGDLAAVSPLTDAAYVWHGAKGRPSTFPSSARLYYCGYDARGNLFMGGTAPSSLKFALFELPKHGNKIEPIHLDRKVKGLGQIQWDGSYVSIEDSYPPEYMYRVKVSGSKGKVVDTIRFDEKLHLLAASWIVGGTVIVPFSVHGTNTGTIGLWNYPAGGTATAIWKHVAGGKRTGSISAVAVSPPH
jgi:hypothetical protein